MIKSQRMVCGWANFHSQGECTTLPLDAMLAAEGLCRSEVQTARQPWGEVAAGSEAGSIAMSPDGRIALLLGRPRWLEGGAAKLALELGNANALLARYSQLGDKVLQELGGNFSLVVLDGGRREALLAIDRTGIERLCFAWQGRTLAFSSSARAVACHPGVQAPINRQALYEYLYCHMVPSPDTAFAGVEKLLPAEAIKAGEGGQPRRSFYWQLSYGSQVTSDPKQRFFELTQQAVARADDSRATGAFLSGGTDSSTVCGMLGRVRNAPAETFSIGFDATGFDELEYARITSHHFGTYAHEYYVTPDDVAEAIPLIAASYDEPFGNASAAPTYFCAKLARENGMAVVLAGDGGDEFFGGNARYAKQQVFEHYQSLPPALRRAAEPAVLGLPFGGSLWPIRKAQSYVRQARIPLPDRLETYNFLHRDPLNQIFDPSFLADIDPDRPLALMREAYFRCASAEPVERMMHLDHKFTLADNDLRKVSRMCEAAGIEVRFPFLDEDLVAFSGTLSTAQKVSRGRLRVLFKDALRGFLPDETISKSKHGFGLPFGVWLNSHPGLQSFAASALKNLSNRGIVLPQYLERLREAHDAGNSSYYGVMIWVLVQMELWMQANT